ncbi:hypothetical protein ACQVBX_08480 [Dyella sp. KULCS107]|uniref:hypothetical protein n=1 Tax=Dyella sp. KULCS107 TaxID=3422216 RepID=UPI003D6E8C3D
MKGIFCYRPGVMLLAGILSSFLTVPSFAGRAYDQVASPSKGSQTARPVEPFHFKVAYLGMSLSEFKSAAKGEPYDAEVGVKRSLFGKRRPVMESLPTPLCSDSGGKKVLSGLARLAPGEVYCDASPGESNIQLRTVAGAPAIKIFYLFYKDRLYCISMDALPEQFEVLESAFANKYGKPARLHDDTYQNGYGAKMVGKKFLWKRGEEMILLREGRSANGAALGLPARAVFLNPSLAPPGAAPVVDF